MWRLVAITVHTYEVGGGLAACLSSLSLSLRN